MNDLITWFNPYAYHHHLVPQFNQGTIVCHRTNGYVAWFIGYKKLKFSSKASMKSDMRSHANKYNGLMVNGRRVKKVRFMRGHIYSLPSKRVVGYYRVHGHKGMPIMHKAKSDKAFRDYYRPLLKTLSYTVNKQSLATSVSASASSAVADVQSDSSSNQAEYENSLSDMFQQLAKATKQNKVLIATYGNENEASRQSASSLAVASHQIADVKSAMVSSANSVSSTSSAVAEQYNCNDAFASMNISWTEANLNAEYDIQGASNAISDLACQYSEADCRNCRLTQDNKALSYNNRMANSTIKDLLKQRDALTAKISQIRPQYRSYQSPVSNQTVMKALHNYQIADSNLGSIQRAGDKGQRRLITDEVIRQFIGIILRGNRQSSVPFLSDIAHICRDRISDIEADH